MRISTALTTVSLAALLAMGGAALAAEATTTSTQDPTQDPTGMLVLGVDITGAGNTADSVKTFVAGLSADQQTGITNGCAKVQADATSNSTVLTFCNNLLGEASGAALTAPVEAAPGALDNSTSAASTTGTNDGGNNKAPDVNN